MPTKTLYEILNVQPTSTQEEIRKSYQQLALEFHPDKAKSTSDRFIEIDEAWKVLRDPDERRQYDAELRQSEFNEKPIVHETLKRSDFSYNDDSQLYYHNCRCGGTYIVPDEEELKAEENAIYIACDECSLVIELEKG